MGALGAVKSSMKFAPFPVLVFPAGSVWVTVTLVHPSPNSSRSSGSKAKIWVLVPSLVKDRETDVSPRATMTLMVLPSVVFQIWISPVVASAAVTPLRSVAA